ncbi:MAG: hypothetical protein AAFX78_02430 [Cyanobacteria bacterium J06638_20]
MSELPTRGHVIPDDVLMENYQRYIDHDMDATATAMSYDPPMRPRTMRDRIKMVYARNLDGRYKEGIVAPGTEIVEEKKRLDKDQKTLFTTVRTAPENSGEFDIPHDWMIAKSTLQLDATGKIVKQWPRVHPKAGEAQSLIEGMREAVVELVGHNGAIERPQVPETTHEDLMTLRPLPDLHLGMYAWGEETGTSWDLKTAMAKYRQLMTLLDTFTPPADTGVILGGGDMIHCDNKRNMTDRSGNPLDVDTRFSKVKSYAMELLVFQVELSRAKHRRTVVRILPGNHDELFADSAAWFLKAWYRNCEDVEIDTDPGDFWFWEWGDVMLGANHGHKLKLTELPRVMSTYKRSMWGRTKFAYAHGFHLHHKEKVGWEQGGVVGEIHQTPVAADAFHHGGGYADGQRTMCVINYNRAKGEQGRWTEPCF